MKIALSLLTVPIILSFCAGVFEWNIDEGMFTLFGISMIVGIVWAWVIELKNND